MKNLLEGGKSSKGTALKLIGHIEKLEPEDDGGEDPVGDTGEENIVGGGQTAGKGTEEQVGGGQTADKRKTDQWQTDGQW